MRLPYRLRMSWIVVVPIIGVIVLASLGSFPARAADPIKIGSRHGIDRAACPPTARPALMAMQIWKDDVNKKGGLLGRPVELIFYDDQTNPATVPGIYTKLLEVDKVDFVVSGYGTNLIAPLMPIVMERKLTLMGHPRPGQQREVQVSELLPDSTVGAGPGDKLGDGLLRAGLQAESAAADGGAGGRRRRVSAARASTGPGGSSRSSG